MDKIASQSCGQKNAQKNHISLFLCLGNKPLEDKTVLYTSGESSDLAMWLGMHQVPKYIFESIIGIIKSITNVMSWEI